MDKHRLIIPGTVILLMLAVLIPGEAPGNSVRNFLPTPGFTDGWLVDGKIVAYTEKDLYKHINGEAELYYPYGFKALATVLYTKAQGASGGIGADIYEMGSLLDAFGIYSRYRDPDADRIDVGAEGFVNESQLLFYKDRYFVRLSALGDADPDRSLFLSCAKAIAARIPGASTPPAALGMLNVPGLVPGTETYIALNVLGYAFFRKGLTADAKIDDGTKARIFVLAGESSVSAEQTIEEYKIYLEKAGAQVRVREGKTGPTLAACDPLYKGVAVRRVDNYVIGVGKLTDPLKAAPLLDALENRIRSR